MRVIIAAILGGLAMFMWSAVTHMGLGLYDSTIRQVPNEAVVTAALKANMTEPGYYFIPGMDMSKTPTDEEMAAFTARHKEGPTALLIYNPVGSDIMAPRQLGIEYASNVAAAFFAALILAFAGVGFGRGVIIATLIGLTGWLSINASYWNWYQFPTGFVTAELIDQVGGWFLSGLVMAFIMRKRA
jgi:hypothetical protein